MKTIPIALQNHMNEQSTTLCLLYRIQCKDGTILGFTSLDVDIDYDDGDGGLTYHSNNGFTIERLQSSSDLAVDNTNLQGWLSDTGVTEQDIRSGLFDYAKIRIYRINYMSPSDGHEIIATGTAGETKFSQNGWITEFRSLTQQLKQTVSKLYSLTCRAQFGDAQCQKPFVWQNGSVTSVGMEPDRIFQDTSNAQPDGHFNIGVVEWLTGNNAGAQMEVDTQFYDVFTLALPMFYPIEVGDTYRVRQDCDKSFAMCRDVHDNVIHNRSEHLIPISDGGSNLVPGAQISR